MFKKANHLWRWMLLLLTIIVVVIFSYWFYHRTSNLTNNQPSLPTPPQLTFSLNVDAVNLKAHPQLIKASQLIFEQLGFNQDWHQFRLPQLSKQHLPLQPQELHFIIETTTNYNNQPVFLRQMYENQLSAGVECQDQEAGTSITCTIYLDKSYFQPTFLSATEQFLTNYIIKSIVLISSKSANLDEMAIMAKETNDVLKENNLGLFTLTSQTSYQFFLPFWQHIKQLLWPVAYANNYCTGELRCYFTEERCYCSNGNSCIQGQRVCGPSQLLRCGDEDGYCTRTCGSSYETDPFFCQLPPNPYCPVPVGGTCGERWPGDTEGSRCRTGGSCYPPSPPPPPRPPSCGDGYCNSYNNTETCANCPQDCGACQGGDPDCGMCVWGGKYTCAPGELPWCATNDQCSQSGMPNLSTKSGVGECADPCGHNPGDPDYNSAGCSVTDIVCCGCECYWPPTEPPNPIPKGNVDAFSCETVTLEGWACDESDYSQPLYVHIYINGLEANNYYGTVLANQQRANVAGQCGGRTNHGFSVSLDNYDWYIAQDINIYVIAENIGAGTGNPQIGSSPLRVNCPYGVCGYVKDDKNQPIVNIPMTILRGDGTRTYASTNSQGHFMQTAFIGSNQSYAIRAPDSVGANLPFEYDGSRRLATTYNYSWWHLPAPTPGRNTQPTDRSYEVQVLGGNDCAGPNASGTRCRCDFTIPRRTTITGNFYLDGLAIMGSEACVGSTSNNLNLSGVASIYSTAQNGSDRHNGAISGSSYSINTQDWKSDRVVTLDLTPQVGQTSAYACSCPDTNPFLCRYYSVASPTENLNFFLKEYNLSYDPWLQLYGGNAYASQNISVNIPDNAFCHTACLPAIMLKDLNLVSSFSSGFPLAGGNTIEDKTKIHLADDRVGNGQQAFATQSKLATYSYSYFKDKVAGLLENYQSNSFSNVNNGELAYFHHQGHLIINDQIVVDNNKRITLFVDGNLTINNPANNNQIISVVPGSFLAFIVSGNITFSSDVGYQPPSLYPNSVFAPPSTVSPNVEGVFIANGQIIIQANNPNTSDKKFIGAGTFVGWQGISLPRDFADDTIGKAWNNYNPTETFIYRPDLVISFPEELKGFLSNWREVNPSWSE